MLLYNVAVQYVIVWINYILLNIPPVVGYLDCFKFFSIIQNSVMHPFSPYISVSQEPLTSFPYSLIAPQILK